ncbi:FliH/SctL family protein [Microbacterium sp. KHB019]|uniref:FliH/SctL family protein n=1 Tax=Microbacterium sp. KHB019 TaxID=3129770 RepID=UPI003079E551
MSTEAFSPAVFPRLHGGGLAAEREQARVRGYADGHAAGFRAGNAAAEAALATAAAERLAQDVEAAQAAADAAAALHAAARSLAERERSLVAATQSQVLSRAVELAELILAGELTDADDSATAAVRRALAAVDSAQVRELRLHPEDIRTLQRLGTQPDGFALTADETLDRGDAFAALDHGFVDARIGSALERARAAAAAAAATTAERDA